MDQADVLQACGAGEVRTIQPLVTVVIVCLNEGPQLQHTVESFRATSPPGTEIVVVDDGSSDGCTDFLEHGETNARLVRTTRCGVPHARNHGARAATGQVLAFADAHVIAPSQWTQPILDALATPGVGAAAPAVYDLNNPVAKGFGFQLSLPALDPTWLSQRGTTPYAVPTLPGCCFAIRREVFDAVGGFDEGMIHWGMEDSELGLRLWLLGYDLLLVPRVEFGHLFRGVLPYDVTRGCIIHNKLRLAFLHFDRSRIERIVDALSPDRDFASGLALLAEGDVTSRAAGLRRRRVRDDSWFFERFGHFD